MKDIAYLTIQERIELLEKSMAFSTSDAANRVTGIADAVLSDFMNFDEEQTGKSKLDNPDTTYSEHCSVLKSKISKELRMTDKSPCESHFGNNYSDYVFSAALGLVSLSGRPKYNRPQIYYNLRMTLGNYLDALIDISFDIEKEKSDTRRANRYRKLKKELSEIIDLSTPLCKSISVLLNQYCNSHTELDRLSHILKCDNQLQAEENAEYEDDSQSYEEYDYPDDNAEYDEYEEFDEQYSDYYEIYEPEDLVPDDFDEDYEEEYDDEEDCDDPIDSHNYYLSESRKLPFVYEQSLKKLYDMGKDNPYLLKDIDYSPEGFRARMAELSPDFRKVADEVITAEGIASAFKEMDAATDKLYRLLIEPFAEIGKYRFQRHLG